MNARLKASALAYAILISLVISLITLSLILAYGIHQKQLAHIENMHRSVRNAESGLTLMLTDRTIASEAPLSMDLFGDGIDSVRLERWNWGAYQIVRSEAKCGKQVVSQIILAGNEPRDSLITLYLADKGKPLSLCGRTRITGTCQLPKSGVKRAYIEGKNYVGRELIYGRRNLSGTSVPDIAVAEFSKHADLDVEQMLFEDLDFSTVHRSFNEKTLNIYSSEMLYLDGVSFSGNILISSEKEITVASNSEISRCIFHAPKVNVESGFEGDMQVYADSIYVDHNVRLDYPSGLYATLKGENRSVVIGENSTVIGQVLLTSSKEKESFLRIEKGSEIYGSVNNQGFTELKGSIHGQLFTEAFILRTPSATYENHLLDATVSLEKLPEAFIGPMQENGALAMITRLE